MEFHPNDGIAVSPFHILLRCFSILLDLSLSHLQRPSSGGTQGGVTTQGTGIATAERMKS
jgi:hypothetical protein